MRKKFLNLIVAVLMLTIVSSVNAASQSNGWRINSNGIPTSQMVSNITVGLDSSVPNEWNYCIYQAIDDFNMDVYASIVYTLIIRVILMK